MPAHLPFPLASLPGDLLPQFWYRHPGDKHLAFFLKKFCPDDNNHRDNERFRKINSFSWQVIRFAVASQKHSLNQAVIIRLAYSHHPACIQSSSGLTG